MGPNPTSLGKVVWLSAVAALVARFPSLLWPLRPDEAGFLLVARAWHPEATRSTATTGWTAHRRSSG